MKQKLKIYNGHSTMVFTIEVTSNCAKELTSSEVYQLMNYEQVILADKLFGIPAAKRDLVRAQQQLERAENAVAYWHNKIHELKRKLEQTSIYDGCELSEHQLRILCDIDIAERNFARKLELCGKAQEAVQKAEAAYVVDIETFRISKL